MQICIIWELNECIRKRELQNWLRKENYNTHKTNHQKIKTKQYCQESQRVAKNAKLNEKYKFFWGSDLVGLTNGVP